MPCVVTGRPCDLFQDSKDTSKQIACWNLLTDTFPCEPEGCSDEGGVLRLKVETLMTKLELGKLSHNQTFAVRRRRRDFDFRLLVSAKLKRILKRLNFILFSLGPARLSLSPCSVSVSVCLTK